MQGQQAPSFVLTDQHGTVHTLEEYAGKWLLLYFYPRDMTPGCTVEAHAFERLLPEFARRGVAVVGVSKLDAASKKKFCDKEGLTLTLLADEDQHVAAAYGVLKEKMMYGKRVKGIARESFLIDPHGTIARHYTNVNPPTHAQEVLDDVSRLV